MENATTTQSVGREDGGGAQQVEDGGGAQQLEGDRAALSLRGGGGDQASSQQLQQQQGGSSSEAGGSSGSGDVEAGGSGITPDGRFSYGWAAAQGRRPTMEDAHLLGVQLSPGHFLFAIFDGHSGRRAVDRVVELLPQALRRMVVTVEPARFGRHRGGGL